MRVSTNQMTESRRVIEALRCGVPNGKAVEVLGCHQPELQREFESLLGEFPAEVRDSI